MEFKLTTNEKDLSKTMIQFNNEELKKEIAEAVEKYRHIVYTDSNISEAKADRAGLRKFVEALEERRKAVKKEYLKPLNKFEDKIKELTDLVLEPILLIDSQVKDYENRQKNEKRVAIETIYLSNIGILKDLLPLTALWDERWLNATYKIADITKEITSKIDKAEDDLGVIIDMGSEFQLEMQDKYLKTLNLGEALKEKSRLEEQKKRLYAFSSASQGHTEGAEVETSGYVQTEDLEEVTFTVRVTKFQKAALRKFLLDLKIKVL